MIRFLCLTLLVAGLCELSHANSVGGYKPVSTSDPDVQAAANFVWKSVAAADSRVNLAIAQDLTINTAEKQVVAGVNYKLALTGFFNQAPITVTAVVYQDLQGNLKLTSYQVYAAENSNRAGGFSPISTSDPDVQAAANFVWQSVAAVDSRVNLAIGKDLTVDTAQKQIVAGVNYKLALTGFFGKAPITVVAVVYKDLHGKMTLSSYDVYAAQPIMDTVPGGYSPVSTTDPGVQAAADFAWKQVAAADSRVNLSYATDLTVDTAEQQVVAGMNYKLALTGYFFGEPITVLAVVYKDLSGTMTLSSYQVIAAGLSQKSAA